MSASTDLILIGEAANLRGSASFRARIDDADYRGAWTLARRQRERSGSWMRARSSST